MASKLLAYADPAALAKDLASIQQAWLDAGNTGELTDARGKPVTPGHPLMRRNPDFAVVGYRAPMIFADVAGGLLEVDATAEAALDPNAVTARAVTKVVPVVTNAATAFKALVPTKEPVGK